MRKGIKKPITYKKEKKVNSRHTEVLYNPKPEKRVSKRAYGHPAAEPEVKKSAKTEKIINRAPKCVF